MKKQTISLLLALLLLVCALPAAALQQGSANYIYSPHKITLPSPPAYTWVRSITANQLEGVDSLANLSGAAVHEGLVYVITADKLLIFDEDFRLKDIITTYQNGQGEQAFTGNSGIFVNPDRSIYIAQAESERILHLNPDFSLKRQLDRPVIDGFENINYRPQKLVADNAGRLYVVAKGMYEGIVELQPDGTFSRFYGVNEVKFTFADLIWRRLATPEQRARQRLWLPTDFTNVAIDKEGFIFATILSSDGMTIKRLNAKGQNILQTAHGKEYPSGDLQYARSGHGIPVGRSQFIAVDTHDSGMFLCLDGARSRVFAYNEDGRLLFVFGGQGDRQGYFRSPVDVRFVGQQIIVLDQLAQSIEVFAPTLYGQVLVDAVTHQHFNHFVEAADSWRQALSFNHNLTLAYSGIGRALLREGRYREALDYLQRGDDREYYSKAYSVVRNEDLKEHFTLIAVGVLLLILLPFVIRQLKKGIKRRKEAAA